ncbi:hypothetical protein GCM10018987_56300 [Streptomyces cremeus]
MGTITFFAVGSGSDLPSAFSAARDPAARRRRHRTPGRLTTKTEAVLIEPDVHTYRAALLRTALLRTERTPGRLRPLAPRASGACRSLEYDRRRRWTRTLLATQRHIEAARRRPFTTSGKDN